MVDTSSFEKSINDALKLEMSGEPTYNENVVASKVSAVVRELIQRRRYKTSGMPDWAIQDDLDNYYTQALNVARYDFNMIGAEGEERHTENGIDRTFSERSKMWAGVVPLGRVIR